MLKAPSNNVCKTEMLCSNYATSNQWKHQTLCQAGKASRRIFEISFHFGNKINLPSGSSLGMDHVTIIPSPDIVPLFLSSKCCCLFVIVTVTLYFLSACCFVTTILFLDVSNNPFEPLFTHWKGQSYPSSLDFLYDCRSLGVKSSHTDWKTLSNQEEKNILWIGEGIDHLSLCLDLDSFSTSISFAISGTSSKSIKLSRLGIPSMRTPDDNWQVVVVSTALRVLYPSSTSSNTPFHNT